MRMVVKRKNKGKKLIIQWLMKRHFEVVGFAFVTDHFVEFSV